MAERYAPWYYYEQTYDSGNMHIFNASVNYFYDDDGHYSSVSGNGAVLNGGAGNDSIWNGDYENYGSNSVKIYVGAGNDIISHWDGANSIIDGGADDDVIYNGFGDSVKIDGGAGNDSIDNIGQKATLNFGNDTFIYNSGNNLTINGGDGNNTINNGLHKDDRDYSGGDKVTITAGSGGDVIQNFNASNISIDAGDGNNLVNIGGDASKLTVKGGTGNDSVFLYTPQDGSAVDSETGEIPNDGNFGGSNISINAVGGKNLVYVADSWNYVTVEGGNDLQGIDLISNGGDNGDIIENYGDNVYIAGDDANGKGNSNFGDYIYTDKGSYVTIDGGAGNDKITAFHDVKASIVGGAGNDEINLERLSVDELTKISLKAFALVRTGVHKG